MFEDARKAQLRKQLMRHEGFRTKPYFDCCGKPFRECNCAKQGKLSIGCGRNLEDVGIYDLEGMLLLSNDIDRVEKEAATLSWFNASLNVARQLAVLDMIFNLGLRGLLGFKKMVKALQVQDYARATHEMLDSKWAGQVGDRSQSLARMMLTGQYTPEP